MFSSGLKSAFSGLVLLALIGGDALASPVHLSRLMRSPVGRYVLTETAEGQNLVRRVAGSIGASYEDDVARMLQRLHTRDEMKPLASELALRLDQINEAFRAVHLSTRGLDSRDVLRQFAGQVLHLKSDRLQFVNIEARGHAGVRRAFVEAGEAESVPETVRSATVVSEEAVKEAAAKASRIKVGVNFRGIRFKDGLEATGSDFRFANLSESRGLSLQFDRALLEWADLSLAELRAVNFRAAEMTGARLHRAKLPDADLSEAVLRNADLSRANLAGADLRGADLRGADLTGAYIQGFFFRPGVSARFEGAFFDAQTKLPFSRREAERLGMIWLGQ